MSYVIPGGLPSLAHPLISNAALGSRNNKSGICRPPFPEIDLSWDGFNLSHLHWVGVKRANYEDWQVGLFLRHELFHNRLGLTAFSRFRKHEMYVLYRLILKTFKYDKRGRKPIPVPLCSDRVRNELEKRWGIVVGLHEASELVEELIAVRSSLLETKDAGDIDPDDLRLLIRGYKRVYGKYLGEDFKKAYDALEFMAGTIGERAAMGLIYSTFEMLHPTVALLTTLFALCGLGPDGSGNGYRWILPKEKTHGLARLSTQEACNSFGNLIELADPDDVIYGRSILLDLVLKVEKRFAVFSRGIGDDFLDHLIYPSPRTFWMSNYDDAIHPFARVDLSTDEGKIEQDIEGYYGNQMILFEAIRQQLTQGKGLLCPFWSDRIGCCNPQHKALLENVWSRTSPDAECKLWRRMGCLC